MTGTGIHWLTDLAIVIGAFYAFVVIWAYFMWLNGPVASSEQFEEDLAQARYLAEYSKHKRAA